MRNGSGGADPEFSVITSAAWGECRRAKRRGAGDRRRSQAARDLRRLRDARQPRAPSPRGTSRGCAGGRLPQRRDHVDRVASCSQFSPKGRIPDAWRGRTRTRWAGVPVRLPGAGAVREPRREPDDEHRVAAGAPDAGAAAGGGAADGGGMRAWSVERGERGREFRRVAAGAARPRCGGRLVPVQLPAEGCEGIAAGGGVDRGCRGGEVLDGAESVAQFLPSPGAAGGRTLRSSRSAQPRGPGCRDGTGRGPPGSRNADRRKASRTGR